jgi:hypothetical protein
LDDYIVYQEGYLIRVLQSILQVCLQLIN